MTPQDIVAINTKYELTPEIKVKLKEAFGSGLKVKEILGHTFVFRPLTRNDWETYVTSWLKNNTKKDISQEEVERHLISVSVVFPSMPVTFDNNPAIEITYWNNAPAGVQPRLAQFIEHHSGYIVPGLYKEEDLYAEDMLNEKTESNEPTPEQIAKYHEYTQLPLRKIRIYNTWWIIRGMTFFEAKNARKQSIDDPEGEYGLSLLEKCILHGPTDWGKQLAGVVTELIKHLRDISGLSENADGPLIDSEAEDL